MVNNNPEQSRLIFQQQTRLYLEPLGFEDINNIINTEKPYVVVTQFAGKMQQPYKNS